MSSFIRKVKVLKMSDPGYWKAKLIRNVTTSTDTDYSTLEQVRIVERGDPGYWTAEEVRVVTSSDRDSFKAQRVRIVNDEDDD